MHGPRQLWDDPEQLANDEQPVFPGISIERDFQEKLRIRAHLQQQYSELDDWMSWGARDIIFTVIAIDYAKLGEMAMAWACSLMVVLHDRLFLNNTNVQATTIFAHICAKMNQWELGDDVLAMWQCDPSVVNDRNGYLDHYRMTYMRNVNGIPIDASNILVKYRVDVARAAYEDYCMYKELEDESMDVMD